MTVDMLENEKTLVLSELGKVNEPLPNMVEMTPEEFAVSSVLWAGSPIYTGFKQIPMNNTNLCIVFFVTNKEDYSGWGVTTNYNRKQTRFFRFTPCDHLFRVPNKEDFDRGVAHPHSCYKVLVCQKCNYVLENDSSD